MKIRMAVSVLSFVVSMALLMPAGLGLLDWLNNASFNHSAGGSFNASPGYVMVFGPVGLCLLCFVVGVLSLPVPKVASAKKEDTKAPPAEPVPDVI